jgi:two-component system, chemotaxis family, protein-glutamate methylesterase/glutaminase
MASHELASAAGQFSLPELVVIGCSRGGLSALTEVLSKLSADFPAAVLVVQHLQPEFDSHLAEILDERTPLHVVQAHHNVKIRRGTVYIAPPDQHVTVNRFGRIRLDSTSKIHFSRPAIDRLFISAATHFQKQVVAVLLSGFGQDGTRGAAAIKTGGGIVIAQNEASSADFGIAGAAIAAGCVERVLPVGEIAGHLTELLIGHD